MSRETEKLEPGDCVYSGLVCLLLFFCYFFLHQKPAFATGIGPAASMQCWKDTSFWFSERIVHLGGASRGGLPADLGSSAVQMNFISANGLTESLSLCLGVARPRQLSIPDYSVLLLVREAHCVYLW